MKKLFASLLLVPSLIWGMVFESERMEDVIPHVGEETWVFLDMDNTLIESCQHLGSAQWRSHIRKKAYNCGYSNEETELALDKFWFFVQQFVSVRLVDPHSVSVIEQLKESNTRVFSLTARDAIESVHTQKQLSSVGISLSSNPLPQSVTLPADRLALLEQGVIYCGENTKSEALVAFFKEMGRTPKKVILVDDKLDQIEELEKTVEAMGIEFVGIRFNAADKRVLSFDGDIADVQFSYLPKIVTDEDADEMLHGFIDLYENED